MHTERFQRRAAVGFATSTRDTHTAVQIGFNRAAVTHMQAAIILTDSDNFYTEFMTENTRICQEGHFAPVSVQICAAHAHTMHPHQCLTLRRLGGFGGFGSRKVSWLL
jgi:hypothetical protein